MNNVTVNNKIAYSYGIDNLFFSIVSLISALICLFSTETDGLELLFLLPLSFTVCSFLFCRVFSYRYDNIALIILFATIFVRYLVTPVLMSTFKSELSSVHPTPDYYRLAICIQIFELYAVMIILDSVWTRHRKRKNLFVNSVYPNIIDFKLSWLGALFLLAIFGIVLIRGHLGGLMNRYSTWWHISSDMSAIYYYDYIAVEIVKSVVGILLISFFARRYRKSISKFKRAVYFMLAIAVSLGMTMFYMYELRTALVQLILASMAVMLGFFPNMKKILFIVFGIGGGVFVAYVFATGSMRNDGAEGSKGLFTELCKMAELYVSGPSMTAITQQNYEWVRENMSIMTYVSDIITSTHIFGMFPFLRGINNLVVGVPTTNILFVESLDGLTYILPNYSLWTYYATNIFGWLFEIISIYAIIRLIGYVDNQKKKDADACHYYALAYVEILLGQAVFVNNTFLLWHAFSGIPFWLLIFVLINKLGSKIRIK